MADIGSPKDRNFLKRYQTIGEGAAKIMWGTPGDWTRCFHEMRRHVPAHDAREMCARWHKEMTGLYTGDAAHRAQS